MKKGNYIVAAICAALSILIIIIASGFPGTEAYGTGAPGPGLWPITISLVMLVCAIALFIRAAKMKPENDEAIEMWSTGSKRVYITMGILLVYVFVLPTFGFIISTTLLQFVLLQWFAKKKWPITLLISAAITLSVYFIFKLLLNVPMSFGFFVL